MLSCRDEVILERKEVNRDGPYCGPSSQEYSLSQGTFTGHVSLIWQSTGPRRWCPDLLWISTTTSSPARSLVVVWRKTRQVADVSILLVMQSFSYHPMSVDSGWERISDISSHARLPSRRLWCGHFGLCFLQPWLEETMGQFEATFGYIPRIWEKRYCVDAQL